jgi:hypothetical protein
MVNANEKKLGFAEALDTIKEKRKMQSLLKALFFVNLTRAFSAPIFSYFSLTPLILIVFLRLKKGKWIFGCGVFMRVS